MTTIRRAALYASIILAGLLSGCGQKAGALRHNADASQRISRVSALADEAESKRTDMVASHRKGNAEAFDDAADSQAITLGKIKEQASGAQADLASAQQKTAELRDPKSGLEKFFDLLKILLVAIIAAVVVGSIVFGTAVVGRYFGWVGSLIKTAGSVSAKLIQGSIEPKEAVAALRASPLVDKVYKAARSNTEGQQQ